MNLADLLKIMITITVFLFCGCAPEASSKEQPTKSRTEITAEKSFLPPSFEGILNRASSGKYFFDEARFYYSIGAFDNAIVKIDRAIELDQNNANFYFLRGAIHFYSGQYQTAVTDLDNAISIDATMAPVYRLRGKAKERFGERRAAAKDFDKAKLLEVEQSKNCKKE
ncbi:MAG: tetratricopeptide repeat protein [Candidatus Melainabacteria bacterium]|nr:tetratricopeptide repeat protein [Candidatus Melainabacteria bacterium]